MKIANAAALAAVFGAEAILFLVTAHHHYAWSYPRWYDQTQYLGQAYGGFERVQSDGLATGIWSMLTPDAAQGCLHGILALPVFEAVGPSRTAALAVNILAFIALQAATFLAARRISGRTSVAWASVGLLAALHFPWSGGAGSAVDFRLDWMAACAYGVTLAIALAGRGFRSTRWAVLLGAAVGATILLRFLTVVYFGFIFFALLLWLIAARDRRSRCWRWALSGIVALCVFAPEFWRNRLTIYNYYWVGHYAGPERALRESHLGPIGSAGWLLSELLLGQIGVATTLIGAVTAVALYWLRLRSRRDPRPGDERNHPGDGAWMFAITFLAVPAAVLAMHPIKAQPPASILIPGAVWIILLLWIRLARPLDGAPAAAVCAAAVLAGSLVFADAERKAPSLDARATDYRTINGLGDYLYFRSEEAGLAHPRVAVTWFLDGIEAESLRILGYERHKRMLPFIMTLPTGLFPAPRPQIMKALAESDFVCLATRAAPVWPFDEEMAGLFPVMRGWCDANMALVGRVDTTGFSLLVYEARGFKARPGGVDLASMVGAALRGTAYREAETPAAPVFVSEAHALSSTKGEFRYNLKAAYSPVRYHAAALPAGLTLDSETGEIRGRFRQPGDFSAEVSASNSSGATSGKLEVHVEDEASFAYLSAPPACSAGVPFNVEFGAYDERRNLDFIDVTDLTTRRTVDRIVASDEQRQSWTGTYRMALAGAGPHIVLMRFVRYDQSAKEPYSFVDHQCVVNVAR